MNKFLTLAALFGLLAVIIGAFGAHGFEKTLTEHAIQRYQTGVEYQFYHVFALLGLGVISSQLKQTSPVITISGIAFVIGIILFSGSLYLYALTGNTKFGMVTPLGGLSFIIGWVCLLCLG
jgi:uncharacterized membrane protein YgdD (TMEM256/DUF423 family)